MTKQIQERFESCTACLQNKNSKMSKKVEVIPEDLTQVAPAEHLYVDFFDFKKKPFLVIKDKASGFVECVMTKDKSTESAAKAMKKFFHTWGFCHKLTSDNGPAFRDLFKEFLKGYGIKHVPSSPYSPSSNGLAERGVRQIKDILKRDGLPSTERLTEICFLVNNHVQDGCGSPAERFLRRRPRSLLPNSIKREVKHRDLVAERHRKQKKLAHAKGRNSAEKFELEDKVVVQCPMTRKWNKRGKISEIRKNEDDSVTTYEIRFRDGSRTWRNKKYISHAKDEKARVRFELPNTELSADKDSSGEHRGPVTRARARQSQSSN